MKNLNKDNHSDFDKSWKEAFEGAEIEPSEDVWLKIDGVLANQESKGFKKTIIFYKYAAAVSLLLLMATTVVSIYLYNTTTDVSRELSNSSQEQILGEQSNEGNTVDTDNMGRFPGTDNNIAKTDENLPKAYDHSGTSGEVDIKGDQIENKQYLSSGRDKTNNGNGVIAPTKEKPIGKDRKKSNPPAMLADENHNTHQPWQSSEIDNQVSADEFMDYADDREFSTLQLLTSKSFEHIKVENTELQKEIYRVPVNNVKKENAEKEPSSKGFFAALQFAPSYFDPNIQMNPNHDVMSANPAAFSMMGVNPQNQEQNLQPQMSYTYGLNFGLKVSKRWLINMGVQYAKNNTSGTTQQYFSNDDKLRFLATPTTLNNFENSSTDRQLILAPSTMSPIDLNNNFEFASVPVKAGYIVVDKKISWIISTGLATDFFLKNEIQDQSNKFEKVTIRPWDSSSPYREIFFNGLASSEIVYRFAKNYSISIEPSYRMALNSFSKSGEMISSRPQTFGVAAGFRVNF